MSPRPQPAPRPRAGGAAASALAAALVAGCAQQGVGVLEATGPAPVVLDAGGARIAVTPPEGFCVDAERVMPDDRAAFVLIEDCALIDGAGGLSDGNAAANIPIPRPAVINGLVTLSIGDGPLFEAPGDRDAAFAGLEDFLRSDRGRATAGMGGDAAAVSIVETRRTPDTLYVLVQDTGERVVPVLGDRFWRGFTEVKDRAVVASLGVFDTDAIRDEQKLAHLARVVAALRTGNDEPVTAAEAQLAAAAPAPRRTARRRTGSASPAPAPAVTAVTSAQGSPPEASIAGVAAALGLTPPPARPDTGAETATSVTPPRPRAEPDGGTESAPRRTMLPPPRA